MAVLKIPKSLVSALERLAFGVNALAERVSDRVKNAVGSSFLIVANSTADLFQRLKAQPHHPTESVSQVHKRSSLSALFPQVIQHTLHAPRFSYFGNLGWQGLEIPPLDPRHFPNNASLQLLGCC